MNSCGNVGQMEERGRLARISGSSSTLTVCSSPTPAALSACTVRLEKPHIGNWAVPFMKRTIGWPSTSDLIRSRTGIALSKSEEHTSELQSLMRISYAVFCLKKKKTTQNKNKSKTHSTRKQN